MGFKVIPLDIRFELSKSPLPVMVEGFDLMGLLVGYFVVTARDRLVLPAL